MGIVALAQQRGGLVQQRSRGIGLQGQGVVEAGQGFVVPAHAPQHAPALEVGLGLLGVQRQGAVVAGQRFVQPAQRLQQHAAAHPPACFPRQGLQRAVQAQQGLLGLAGQFVQLDDVVVEHRLRRGQGDGALDPRGGAGDVAALVLGHAQQMRGFGVVGLLAQQGEVRVFGGVHVTRLVPGQGLLQHQGGGLVGGRCGVFGGDRQVAGRQALQGTVEHALQGGFQGACEAGRVEQQAAGPLLAQAFFQRLQALRVAPQGDGGGLEGFGGVGHQLLQAGGVEYAGGHAAGEGAAAQREHRQPGPQRIAGGGACRVGGCVQQQVWHLHAGHVFGVAQTPADDDAAGLHAQGAGVLTQLFARIHRLGHQVQHAAGHLLQDAPPAGEGLGQDLVGVVDDAEHHALFGQLELRPGGGLRRHVALRRVGLVHGQAGQLLREVPLFARRYQGGVGQQVVVAGRAHGAQVADVAGLHGCHAPGEQAGARTEGVAAEVDGDVQHLAPGGFHHGGVCLRGHVDEAVARAAHALGDGVCVAAQAEAQHLEALPVVLLQHFHHQPGHGVVVEVG